MPLIYSYNMHSSIGSERRDYLADEEI